MKWKLKNVFEIYIKFWIKNIIYNYLFLYYEYNLVFKNVRKVYFCKLDILKNILNYKKNCWVNILLQNSCNIFFYMEYQFNNKQ